MNFNEFVLWIFAALLALGVATILVQFAITSWFDHKRRHLEMLTRPFHHETEKESD